MYYIAASEQLTPSDERRIRMWKILGYEVTVERPGKNIRGYDTAHLISVDESDMIDFEPN